MSPRPTTDAREKILNAAASLFYEQGYQATTIDHVIERSGVSRPTLYSYFKTKEILCLAYLAERRKSDLAQLKEAVRKEPNPKARYLRIMTFVQEHLKATSFRGCAYFNMISEVVNTTHPIAKEARIYIDGFREIIKDAVLDLKASDSKYKKLDVERVSDTYYLLLNGAIMSCQEYNDTWPIDRAVEEVERLLDH